MIDASIFLLSTIYILFHKCYVQAAQLISIVLPFVISHANFWSFLIPQRQCVCIIFFLS